MLGYQRMSKKNVDTFGLLTIILLLNIFVVSIFSYVLRTQAAIEYHSSFSLVLDTLLGRIIFSSITIIFYPSPIVSLTTLVVPCIGDLLRQFQTTKTPTNKYISFKDIIIMMAHARPILYL